MHAFDQAHPLQRALDELSALGGDQDRESIDDARYQEGTGRLEKALTAAGDRRSAIADEVAAHDRELPGRFAAIDQALALLDSAAAPGARRIAS